MTTEVAEVEMTSLIVESVLLPGRATAEEVISRARAIRDAIPKGSFTGQDIDAVKHEGRP